MENKKEKYVRCVTGHGNVVYLTEREAEIREWIGVVWFGGLLVALVAVVGYFMIYKPLFG